MKAGYVFPIIFVLCLGVLTNSSVAQSNSANVILDKMLKNSQQIRDYEVTVKIKTNVEFLKIPDSESQLFFKQPDKIKLKSDRFAMLPKKFQFFSPMMLLKHEHTSFIEREEKFNNYSCYVMKIVPTGENSEIVLTTAWVDKTALVFRKIEITAKNGGSMNLVMDYDPNFVKQYALPSSIIYSFDVSNVSLPKGMGGNFDEPEPRKKKSNLTKGTVELDFRNYKVNTGIDDKFFEEKKK